MAPSGVTRRSFASFQRRKTARRASTRAKAGKHSPRGSPAGARKPVVVKVILPANPLTAGARISPSSIPGRMAAEYWASWIISNPLPVSPRVFKIPRLAKSCRMPLPIWWPSTAIDAASSTAAKASRKPLKAFCSTSIKPRMASRLWANLVYWGKEAPPLTAALNAAAVRPSSAAKMWSIAPSRARASIPAFSRMSRAA